MPSSSDLKIAAKSKSKSKRWWCRIAHSDPGSLPLSKLFMKIPLVKIEGRYVRQRKARSNVKPWAGVPAGTPPPTRPMGEQWLANQMPLK